MPDATAWVQILLQAGAFGLLVLLVWNAPTWMREARESRQKEAELQQKERKEERDARNAERKEEREARHSLADQFHRSILAAMAANISMREEDRKAFEERNHDIVAAFERALERQTTALTGKLDQVHADVTDVQKLVVKAENVTVIPPKSD